MIFQLLKDVCGILESFDLEYMISGSIALNHYTIPRMTRDIDIVIRIPEEQIENFSNAFKGRFYINVSTVFSEVKRKGKFNIIDNLTGNKVDFIICKETPYRKTEFSRKIRTNAFGTQIWMVTIEDLVLSKLIWIQDSQSEIQMRDIQYLMENIEIDFDYIKLWCSHLTLKTYGLL
jgi:hypothetical protein